jgi:hypothetical protein
MIDHPVKPGVGFSIRGHLLTDEVNRYNPKSRGEK